MKVVKVVDQDVAEKVDTEYIAAQFPALEHVSIIFFCTLEGGEEDEWEEDGVRYIAIHLPYELVRKLDDIRPMMLEKARARLGV